MAIIALLAACSNGGRTGQHAQIHPASDMPTNSVLKPAYSRPSSTSSAKTAPAFVERFDFGERLEQAHFRSGGLLVDFGTPARHKHTLGDWRSGFKGDFEKAGVTFSYVTGRTARLFFHAFPGETGGGSIALRARGHGAGSAQVFLNGKSVGTVELSPSELSHGVATFEDGITPGRNEIELRTSARGRTEEGYMASMAVDYIRITPGEASSGPAAAAYDAVRHRDEGAGRDDISLSDGESVTFFAPVEPGMSVRGSAASLLEGKDAKVALEVRTDVLDSPLSWSRELKNKDTEVFMDLSSLAGKTAAISVSSAGGEVLLRNVGLFIPAGEGEPKVDIGAKNLVLVLIDTLRADKIDIYNPGARVKTPYLSSLGQEAVVFKRAFAPENWTKPSVASLLTGLFPETHATKDDRDVLPPAITTIQEHLKSLGFTTAGFVANGYISDKFGFRRGFDTWTNYVREGKRNRAEFVISDAASWLSKQPSDRPFFLYVHTIDPHVPYIPPSKYLSMYDSGPYGGIVKANETAKLAEKIKTHRITLNDRDRQRFEALYDGEISYHDDQLIHLHEALEASGRLEDTAIIITSDHGEEFFDHGLCGHGHSLYEELLHVPLFVRLPGDAATKMRKEKSVEVSLVDIFPTACELLCVECPAELEGESLASLLKGETDGRYPSVAFAEFLDGQRAARMGGYKLILRGDKKNLFDLERDPGETKDLSEEHPIALTALTDALGAHLGRFIRAGAVSDGRRTPTKHKADKATIDPETERQLKALGYLGGE